MSNFDKTKVRGSAKLYHQVRLWEEGTQQLNLVLAYPHRTREPWAVITDEPPCLNVSILCGTAGRISTQSYSKSKD